MAIIVEDGTGKIDAESFASVVEADAYVAKWYGAHADWGVLDEAGKEVSLRRGTLFVGSREYKGVRAVEDQAQSWPRIYMGWIDGHYVDNSEMPVNIINASIEAAVRDAEGEILFPDHYDQRIASESKGVGPLTKKYTYEYGKEPGKTFESVEKLIRPFLKSGQNGTLERGIG